MPHRWSRRAAFLATLSVALSVTGAVGAQTTVQPTVATASNTVTVDLSRSLGAFGFRPGRQLSATPNTWRFAPATLANLEQLHLDRVRVWLSFTQTYDVATRTPDYAKWYEYLDTYSSLASTLILNWRSDYDPLVTEGTLTEAELFAAQRDMLAHYKQRYPKIEFVESEAEPPVIAAYYPKYRLLYRVVNAVNALGLPGPALKVGGPTIDATSDALSSRGTGVCGLAGATTTRIAAMTWNYQWTGQTTYDSRIVFTNFPAAWRNTNVLVERYRIDKDVHSGDLMPVDRFVIGPRTAGTYYSPYFPLDPNELRLMVLTPTSLPIGQLPVT